MRGSASRDQVGARPHDISTVDAGFMLDRLAVGAWNDRLPIADTAMCGGSSSAHPG
jgi:hypothetical protein